LKKTFQMGRRDGGLSLKSFSEKSKESVADCGSALGRIRVNFFILRTLLLCRDSSPKEDPRTQELPEETNFRSLELEKFSRKVGRKKKDLIER